MRIKFFTPIKIMEKIKPERFSYALEEPLPSPQQAIKLEIYREKGCEVEYNVPRWVEEERKKETVFGNMKSLKPIEEVLHELPRIKTKKMELSKKYVFLTK